MGLACHLVVLLLYICVCVCVCVFNQPLKTSRLTQGQFVKWRKAALNFAFSFSKVVATLKQKKESANHLHVARRRIDGFMPFHTNSLN